MLALLLCFVVHCKSKETGILQPIFPDYVIFCDYGLSYEFFFFHELLEYSSGLVSQPYYIVFFAVYDFLELALLNLAGFFFHIPILIPLMKMMMNCSCGMVHLRTVRGCISRRNHCQEASSSWLPRMPWWESIPDRWNSNL